MVKKWLLKLWQAVNLLFPFFPDWKYYDQMRRIEETLDRLNKEEYERRKK